MTMKMTRRQFLKSGAALSTAAAAGASALPSLLSAFPKQKNIDVVAIQSQDYFAATQKAVELLGGIKKFVRPGSKVGVLANSVWGRRGAYTHPDITIALVIMCLAAGANEVRSLEDRPGNYWRRSKLYPQYKDQLDNLPSGGRKIELKLDPWKSLKTADVCQNLIECDVFINVPIVKNHLGTVLSGNLKNMMGTTSGSTNRFFHTGSGVQDDATFLGQCVADINLVRRPDLCVLDATEFITTNGPAGPGLMMTANKVVAGRNPVSVDAYAATLFGLKPENVPMIFFAQQHGLGEIRLDCLSIHEAAL